MITDKARINHCPNIPPTFNTTSPDSDVFSIIIEPVPYRKIQCRGKEREATREYVCDVSWQRRQIEERRAVGRPSTAEQQISCLSHARTKYTRVIVKAQSASGERIVLAVKRSFTPRVKLAFFTPHTAAQRKVSLPPQHPSIHIHWLSDNDP